MTSFDILMQQYTNKGVLVNLVTWVNSMEINIIPIMFVKLV